MISGWQKYGNTGYLLENVAMQHNFRHDHIKFPVFDDLVDRLGQPVTFDAAQAGSYAHRLRNYWTNLADPSCLQKVLDCLRIPHEHTINDIIGPTRMSKTVEPGEQTISGVQYNQVGKPRVVMPTLMAFPRSRAFRAGRQGCIFDIAHQQFDEPTAHEREVIMGFEPSSTAAPGVTERERRALLGQAIDINALTTLWSAATTIARRSQEIWPLPLTKAAIRSRKGQGNHSLPVLSMDEGQDGKPSDIRQDIWEDKMTLRLIQEHLLPADPENAKRSRKRALHYRWFNNRLFKLTKDHLTMAPEYRLVPPPRDRDSIIIQTHNNLGHIGEKRTTAAMSSTYWWHGMTQDIKRVVSGCKVCKRVGVNPPAATQEMQTEPHDYGLFIDGGWTMLVNFPLASMGTSMPLYALITCPNGSR
jgi:hypothetical protein